MDITVEAIEALRVPNVFTPVVGYKRFGILWPPREAEHCLVQKGHRWEPKQVPTTAECRRPGSSTTRAHATPYQDCGVRPARLYGSRRGAALLRSDHNEKIGFGLGHRLGAGPL